MKIKAFITHKLAESYSDCQDFFKINPQRHSIAVADGMSQSIFPLWWAEELVNAYTEGKSIDIEINKLQENWLKRVNKRIVEKEEEKAGSAWRIIDNLNSRKGAGSTLCGITFDGFKWSSFIVGDTSIITIDSNFHIQNIYNSNTHGFSNHPDYFDSIKEKVGNDTIREGVIEENTYILLVSDPLGEFLELKHKQGGEDNYVKKLISIQDHTEFLHHIDLWRDSEKMHNDDTTCIIIQNNGNLEFELEVIDDLTELINKQQTNNVTIPQSFNINEDAYILNIQEINEKSDNSIKDEELDCMAHFCCSIIRLFQKKRKVKTNEFEKILKKYSSVKNILKKYIP